MSKAKQFWTNVRLWSAPTADKTLSEVTMASLLVFTTAIYICALSALPARIATSYKCRVSYLISLNIDLVLDVTFVGLRSIDCRQIEASIDAISAIMMFV